MINKFDGEYQWLSNFYDCPIEFDGLTYKNSEAAYQAQKTLDHNIRKTFTNMSALESKRAGKKLKLRPNWEEIKIGYMRLIIHKKFRQNEDLKQKLIQTGNQELIEGNYWHDCFWGVCNGIGENWLGKILMEERDYWIK
jgi:hypothetical protein